PLGDRHVIDRVRQVGVDAGGGQGRAGVGDLGGEGDVAVAGDRVPHVGQRLAGQPFHVGDLGLGPVRVQPYQAAGQLGHDGERVAEDVVQVAGEPVALVLDREPADLLPGGVELAVALDDLHHAPHR